MRGLGEADAVRGLGEADENGAKHEAPSTTFQYVYRRCRVPRDRHPDWELATPLVTACERGDGADDVQRIVRSSGYTALCLAAAANVNQASRVSES